MQKVDARKWLQAKESFDQYAIEKLALMHQLDLPEEDRIHLLIGGIAQSSLRATALSVAATSLDVFLERMRQISEGVGDGDRKPSAAGSGPKKDAREVACRNCGKKGHSHKECRGELVCFYCKNKGHRRFDCPALHKRDAKIPTARSQPSAASVSTDVSANSVASVSSVLKNIEICNPFITVNNINGKSCNLSALIDTGSPVSFVTARVYEKYVKPTDNKMLPVNSKLRNLSDRPIDIAGKIRANLKLEKLNDNEFETDLHVLNNNAFEGDFILGREFLEKEKLTLIYSPSAESRVENINLFTHLPLCVEDEQQADSLESQIEIDDIDFGSEIKSKLKAVIMKAMKKSISLSDDDYEVRVRLKDPSIYAYSPRRMAHAERLQIRAITDDLL